jgi:hypothetical protein
MHPSRAGDLQRVLVTAALALALAMPGVTAAEEAAKSSAALDWETGAGKNYWIPALEVGGFIFGLNQFDRHFLADKQTYDTDEHTFWKNLRTAPDFDTDPFSVNQLGHPYQGSIYYGFPRSTGLSYWESLLYTLGGSFLWETYGETSRPSINDHIASGIGGTFVGEAMFRMASLLLENGGEHPGFWRELGAGIISPPTGFNRLVFGDRFDAIFPSRDPAIFIRLRFGVTLTSNVTNEGLASNVKREEGSADFSMDYGLPGKPGYRYTRPFDYFHFEFTAVPNASTVANAIENVSIRGLLVGAKYEWGEDYRGVWGLFGGYDYLSPQIFRVATTEVGLGTVAQWWLSRTVALQGTALGAVGFGAAGTVADRAERDYHYGVIPHVLLGLRVLFGDLAMLEGAGRTYFVAGTGNGAGVSTDVGGEVIARGNVGLTVRVYGPHALGLQYLVTSRDAKAPDVRARHQSVETVTLSYNFIGHTRFGAVEWRPDVGGGR